MFVFLGLGSCALAMEPLETDRPDYTESAKVVVERSIQFESGYTYTQTPGVANHTLGELLIRAWMMPKWEARLGVGSYSWQTELGHSTQGKDDLSVGFKYQWSEAQASNQQSTIFTVYLPTGDSGFQRTLMEPELKQCFSGAFNEHWGWGINTVVRWIRSDGNDFIQFSRSGVIDLEINESVSGYGEIYATTPTYPGGPSQWMVGGGLTYLSDPDTQWDLRAMGGINGQFPDYFVGVGFSKRLFY